MRRKDGADFVRSLPRIAHLADKIYFCDLYWLHTRSERDLTKLGLSLAESCYLFRAVSDSVHVFYEFITSEIVCELSNKTIYFAQKMYAPGVFYLNATDMPNFDTYQELRILKQIVNCDYVPQLVAHGALGSTFYLVTEPVGITLTQVPESLELAGARIMQWGLELWRCLCNLHDRGVFHRDITPSNIILVDEHLQLANFGGEVTNS